MIVRPSTAAVNLNKIKLVGLYLNTENSNYRNWMNSIESSGGAGLTIYIYTYMHAGTYTVHDERQLHYLYIWNWISFHCNHVGSSTLCAVTTGQPIIDTRTGSLQGHLLIQPGNLLIMASIIDNLEKEWLWRILMTKLTGSAVASLIIIRMYFDKH